MDLSEVISTRRSVRVFRPDLVPDEALLRVFDLARMAPSANNTQPWKLIVVRDETKRDEIARLCFDQEFIGAAPVVMVICAERYEDHYSWIAEKMYLVDTTIFADHLALAARSEGLGTCWIGAFDRQRHQDLKRLLMIPPTHDVAIVMPIGYPRHADAFRETRARKPLDAIVACESFDGPSLS